MQEFANVLLRDLQQDVFHSSVVKVTFSNAEIGQLSCWRFQYLTRARIKLTLPTFFCCSTVQHVLYGQYHI